MSSRFAHHTFSLPCIFQGIVSVQTWIDTKHFCLSRWENDYKTLICHVKIIFFSSLKWSMWNISKEMLLLVRDVWCIDVAQSAVRLFSCLIGASSVKTWSAGLHAPAECWDSLSLLSEGDYFIYHSQVFCFLPSYCQWTWLWLTQLLIA